MKTLSFIKFKQHFSDQEAFKLRKKNNQPTNMIAKNARDLLKRALKNVGPTVAQERFVQIAAKRAGIAKELVSQSFTEKFSSSGEGSSHVIWALYYSFHFQGLNSEIIDDVDKLLLGSRFEDVANQPVRSKRDKFTYKPKSAWSINNDKLKLFFEPMFPEHDVERLIAITHEVVDDNLETQPIDYKDSIVERAINEGVINTEFGNQWLTAALWSGLTPDIESGFVGEGIEDFAEMYADRWRFFGSKPTDEGQTWLQRIAENSEDREFLAQERETTGSQTLEDQKRRLLLDCLLATQESSPVIAGMQSVVGHLTQISDMSLSDQTRDFIDYAKARNAAVTGQSELAIQTYYRLRDRPFKPERKVNIRYHLINASWALRHHSLYGTRDVSTELKLSPENDRKIQRKLNDTLLDGFDADREIKSFCADFEIDPENFSEKDIEEYVRRFNGPNGAKIIYFYHLEAILRTGKSARLEMEERYDEIVRMLKMLSCTSRRGDSSTYFTKDAWYPLVLLHSVAANMENYTLMKKIERELATFDGWKHRRSLLADVADETSKGSFLTLVHRLNVGLGEVAQNKSVGLSARIREMHESFAQLRFMPALSQNVLTGIRALGDEYDKHQDVTALAKRGVSHWNYMVGGGTINIVKHL